MRMERVLSGSPPDWPVSPNYFAVDQVPIYRPKMTAVIRCVPSVTHNEVLTFGKHGFGKLSVRAVPVRTEVGLGEFAVVDRDYTKCVYADRLPGQGDNALDETLGCVLWIAEGHDVSPRQFPDHLS